MSYDPNNIFARILRGEIPCKKIYEDQFVLAFEDIAPKKPVHVLVIPKGAYVSFDDFAAHASDTELTGFFKAVRKVATHMNLSEAGYRLIANHAEHGGQEVPHFHVHILGGAPVGQMVS